jgi:hypothetical protein
MTDQRSVPPPACGQGHTITPAYTIEEVRTLEVLVFHCEVCDERWNATPEERDAFLEYLQHHPGTVVPS